ncbi:TMEM165/GDT1 family protein [Rhodoferax sp.]|uniref:TMEM165/GDT1 family protein n=1 Tax=Rhodoferax sp. TaxID=50421 RepID=UPI002775C17C|nr:TMEM165/GDT1 family protein [Rhodoferax sp.]
MTGESSFFSETMLVLGIVALAEIADKTMFVTIGLAAKYPPGKVLLGIIPACFAVPAIGILIALVFKTFLSEQWLQIISGGFFVGLVGWSLHEMAEDEGEDGKKRWWHRFGPTIIAFCAFFVAEMADRTQFVTITMTTSGGNIYADWLGSALGLVLANVIALILVTLAGKRIPKLQLMYGAAVLFLMSAVWMFADAAQIGRWKWFWIAVVGILGFNAPMYRLVIRNLAGVDAVITKPFTLFKRANAK